VKKNPFVLATLLSLSFSQPAVGEQVNPNSSPTKWQAIPYSLTNYLDDGWQLVGQSSHRVTDRDTDSMTFVYTVSKNGKYVTCSLTNPRAETVTYSACRVLN
jgi:hypothetical protein